MAHVNRYWRGCFKGERPQRDGLGGYRRIGIQSKDGFADSPGGDKDIRGDGHTPGPDAFPTNHLDLDRHVIFDDSTIGWRIWTGCWRKSFAGVV